MSNDIMNVINNASLDASIKAELAIKELSEAKSRVKNLEIAGAVKLMASFLKKNGLTSIQVNFIKDCDKRGNSFLHVDSLVATGEENACAEHIYSLSDVEKGKSFAIPATSGVELFGKIAERTMHFSNFAILNKLKNYLISDTETESAEIVFGEDFLEFSESITKSVVMNADFLQQKLDSYRQYAAENSLLKKAA